MLISTANLNEKKMQNCFCAHHMPLPAQSLLLTSEVTVDSDSSLCMQVPGRQASRFFVLAIGWDQVVPWITLYGPRAMELLQVMSAVS